jgi:hypothetical protein
MMFSPRLASFSAWLWLGLIPITGCQLPESQPRPLVRHGLTSTLTDSQMDALAAGTATGMADAVSLAVGFAPQTNSSENVTARQRPIGDPITNSVLAQSQASAFGEISSQANSNALIHVDGGSGGAGIIASANGAGSNGGGSTYTVVRLLGVSTDRADIAFGTAIAAACCGAIEVPLVVAQTTSGGRYTQEQVALQMSGSNQKQTMLTVSVVSSSLPLVGPGQAIAATGHLTPLY